MTGHPLFVKWLLSSRSKFFGPMATDERRLQCGDVTNVMGVDIDRELHIRHREVKPLLPHRLDMGWPLIDPGHIHASLCEIRRDTPADCSCCHNCDLGHGLDTWTD
jgi:hypothetical protein